MDESVKSPQIPNFQKELDHVLNRVLCQDTKPSLFLHSCCGPCSSYCLSYLNDFFQITVFYYNPNIDPYEEYQHRLSEQKRLIDCLNQDLSADIQLVEGSYDHNEFLEAAKGLEEEPEGGKRCRECFFLRLSETEKQAAFGGFDYFATTLTVSPHKNALWINEVGEECAQKDQTGHLLWLPSDFKKKNGYQKSIELSRKYKLYRQNYCGCEFAR